MSENERYEALKNRLIPLNAVAIKEYEIENYYIKKYYDDNLYTHLSLRDKKKLFITLAEEFGATGDYINSDVKLDFTFSLGNLKHSVVHQKKNYASMAKMFSCFANVIDNAVGIEVHKREGYKPDSTLRNVYVLASAFVDGNEIIPVKLEIKEFSDKKNILYVAIALESIKKDEVVTQGDTINGVTKQYARSSIISISDLFKKINPSDESFLKYIPDGFLDADQKQSKYRALEKDGIKKSLKDTSSVETRESIAEAFKSLAATDGEKKIVKDYAKSIEKMDKSFEKKKDLFLKLQELKGKTDSESKAQREKYAAEIQKINDDIVKADESLLKIAAAEPFRSVVRKYQTEAYNKGYGKGFDAREGYILKTVAKYSHTRYYNKKDVEAAIAKAPKIEDLTQNRRTQLADELTKKLNKAKNDSERAVITRDFIIGKNI